MTPITHLSNVTGCNGRVFATQLNWLDAAEVAVWFPERERLQPSSLLPFITL
ncbi:hypothetical protein ACNQFN_22060 [Thauera butanivorans]|uniref:hypothetical protein n=1 Tax=Thauera butanivorans TaxID=86174 RepID=UPI003AB153D4